jgi:hypothetical protein
MGTKAVAEGYNVAKKGFDIANLGQKILSGGKGFFTEAGLSGGAALAGIGVIASMIASKMMTHGNPDPFVGIRDLSDPIPLEYGGNQKSDQFNFQTSSGDLGEYQSETDKYILDKFNTAFQKLSDATGKSVNEILDALPEHFNPTASIEAHNGNVEAAVNDVYDQVFSELLNPLLLEYDPNSVDGELSIERIVDRRKGPVQTRDSIDLSKFDTYAYNHGKDYSKESYSQYKGTSFDTRDDFDAGGSLNRDIVYRSFGNDDTGGVVYRDVNNTYTTPKSGLLNQYDINYFKQLGDGDPFEGYARFVGGGTSNIEDGSGLLSTPVISNDIRQQLYDKER